MTAKEIKRRLLTGDIKDAAEIAGVHYNTARNYLNGRHRPKSKTDAALYAAFSKIIQARQKRELVNQ